MREGAVTLGYIYDEDIRGAFCDALLAFAGSEWAWRVFDPERGGGTISFSTTNIPEGRNDIVSAFLDEDCGEWLMMVDSDHSFAPNAFERLIEVALQISEPGAELRPVVGGLCFAGGRSSKIVPTMYKVDDWGMQDGNGVTMRTVDSWTPGTLVQVDATGAAFLLVHRSVLARMREAFPTPKGAHWFATGFSGNTRYGEDFFFCVRCKQIGVPIVVHTGVQAPHHKWWIIDSYDFERYKELRDTYGEEALAEMERAKRKGVPYALVPKQADGPAAMNRQQRRAEERKRR